MRSNRLSGWFNLLVVVVVSACFTGCNVLSLESFYPLVEETRAVTVEHEIGTALEIQTGNGGVVVSRADRDDVQIVASLKAVSAERLEAAEVITERDSAGKLYISVKWPDGKRRSREGCRFELQVPDATGVVVQTSNGLIELSGLCGRADLHTSNGAVTVRAHAGPIYANSSNGRIDIEETVGDIEVSTSNGPVTIVGATNCVNAESSNGSIDIAFAPEGEGPLDVRTSNGEVTLDLGASMQGEVSLSTSNGSIRVDSSCDGAVRTLEKKQAILDFGGSDARSTVSTSNGTIRIARAIDTAH